MKMIESEGRATQLQAIEKVVDCIRQRQRNLNSAFKISYKRVLRKNHASRLFKLFKKNQLKRQKSCRHLPIYSKQEEIHPSADGTTNTTEATQSRAFYTARSQCFNSARRPTQGLIPVTNQAGQSATCVTPSDSSSSSKISEQRVRHSFPSTKAFRPPFLSRNRSEKILRPQTEGEVDGGQPQSQQEKQIFHQIEQENLRIPQNEIFECQEERGETMNLLKRITDLTSENYQFDFQEAFHERNMQRVSWRRPGKSTFFFNRFRNEEENKRKEVRGVDELSSAASSDDIVL